MTPPSHRPPPPPSPLLQLPTDWPCCFFVYFIGTSSWGKCSCFSGRLNSEVGHNPSLRHGDENRWVKTLCHLWQPQKKEIVSRSLGVFLKGIYSSCAICSVANARNGFFVYNSLKMSFLKFVIVASHNRRWNSNESNWFCESTRSGQQAREKHKRASHELGLVLLLIGLEGGARFFSQSQSTTT